MKNILSLLAILSLALTMLFSAAPVAKADGGFYIEGKIGFSNQQIDRELKVNDRYVSSTGIAISGSNVNFGKSSSNSLAGGLALGYNFMPSLNVPLRIDFEYLARTYKSTDSRGRARITGTDTNNANATATIAPTWHEKSEIGIHTLLFNFYYDIYTSTQFTPFIGASLGLAILHAKVDTLDLQWFDLDDIDQYGWANFAWGFTGGVNYALNDDVSFDLSYRYLNGDTNAIKRNLPVSLKVGLDIHDVMFGVRYTF